MSKLACNDGDGLVELAQWVPPGSQTSLTRYNKNIFGRKK